MLNDSLSKDYVVIFATTDLTGSGVIENFTQYNEFIIIICANGFYQTYYVQRKWLDINIVITFVSSWIHDNGIKAMATIGLNGGGYYEIAKGVGQNSSNSSISIYAR